jgi:Ni,Fe-hydrogenase III large subunit
VRRDHPFASYRRAPIQVATAATGDVLARAQIRAHEIEQSINFVRTQVPALAASALMTPLRALRPQHLTVALTEGWRGEIVHVAATDSGGKLCAYKIVDPSFHNWMGLAMALRGNQISDFPLNNKSFNLSYAGHDL